MLNFFFQAEDGIRDPEMSRGLGDVYKRQMSRAFKPMPVVLELVYENFSKYKNLIFFMGKSGKRIFENSKKNWEMEYIEKKSLTSEDSFLINIKKIKKKN